MSSCVSAVHEVDVLVAFVRRKLAEASGEGLLQRSQELVSIWQELERVQGDLLEIERRLLGWYGEEAPPLTGPIEPGPGPTVQPPPVPDDGLRASEANELAQAPMGEQGTVPSVEPANDELGSGSPGAFVPIADSKGLALASLPTTDEAPVAAGPVVVPTDSGKLRTELGRLRDAFLSHSRAEDCGNSPTLLKALIAEARAVLVLASLLREEDAEVKKEFESLRDAYRSSVGVGYYFGLDMAKLAPYTQWDRVAEAYRLFQVAEDAWAWLSAADRMNANLPWVLDGAAACEALLYRLLYEIPDAFDPAQSALNARLRALSSEVARFVRWWDVTSSRRPLQSEVRAAAKAFADKYAKFAKNLARPRPADAVKCIESVIRDANGPALEAELHEVVERVLSDGLPPSNKALRGLLLPYVHVLEGRGEESPSGQLAKLIEYLRQDGLELLATHRALAPEPDLPADPEIEAKRRDLVELLRGKVVLFVGGRKGQHWRPAEYRKALELKELRWPDVEHSSGTAGFESEIAKADVVCQLVRFSRHSYKEVIDDAKRRGKLTAVLPRGLGLNTVVFDLHRQLIAQKASPERHTGP